MSAILLDFSMEEPPPFPGDIRTEEVAARGGLPIEVVREKYRSDRDAATNNQIAGAAAIVDELVGAGPRARHHRHRRRHRDAGRHLDHEAAAFRHAQADGLADGGAPGLHRQVRRHARHHHAPHGARHRQDEPAAEGADHQRGRRHLRHGRDDPGNRISASTSPASPFPRSVSARWRCRRRWACWRRRASRPIVCHAQGKGDKAMEEMIRAGAFHGVLDICIGGVIETPVQGQSRPRAGPADGGGRDRHPHGAGALRPRHPVLRRPRRHAGEDQGPGAVRAGRAARPGAHHRRRIAPGRRRDRGAAEPRQGTVDLPDSAAGLVVARPAKAGPSTTRPPMPPSSRG